MRLPADPGLMRTLRACAKRGPRGYFLFVIPEVFPPSETVHEAHRPKSMAEGGENAIDKANEGDGGCFRHHVHPHI
jgi:hypothetical protein